MLGWLCGGQVLAGEAAEDLFSADLVPGQVDLRRRGVRLRGWELVKGAVWPGGVVVLQVLGQDLAQVALVEDEQPAGDLAAQGADHALADRIRLWRLRRAEKDPDTRGGEHGVEKVPEMGGAGPAVMPARCARRVPCSVMIRA